MRGHFAENLIGERFGWLEVIDRAQNRYSSDKNGRKHVSAYWKCRCECGLEKEIRADHLKSGRVVSCGCKGIEHSANAKKKHDQRYTRLYGVWCNMKNRCRNPNVRSYKDYGDKGVVVCEEWANDFGAFSRWAYKSGYDPNASYGKCTIDRIDPFGNYCPENCRWVDLKIQANNKRNSKQISVGNVGTED